MTREDAINSMATKLARFDNADPKSSEYQFRARMVIDHVEQCLHDFKWSEPCPT